MKKIAVFVSLICFLFQLNVFAKEFYIQDTNDNWIIENNKKITKFKNKYISLKIINDNLILAKNNKNQLGIIDKKENIIVEFGKYDEINDFISGHSLVKNDNKLAVINEKGEEVIPLSDYEIRRILKDKYIFVCEDLSGYKIYDNNLNLKLENIDKESYYVSYYDSCLVINSRVMNSDLKFITDKIITYMDSLKNIIIVLNNNSKYEIIDLKTGDSYGEYYNAKFLNDSIILSNNDGEQALMDLKGNIIYDFGKYKYEGNLYGSSFNYIIIKDNNNVGVIDYKGNIIIPVGKYKEVLYLMDKSFSVKTYDDKRKYITNKGKNIKSLDGYFYLENNKISDKLTIIGKGYFDNEQYILNINNNKKVKKLKNFSYVESYNDYIVCKDYQKDIIEVLDKNAKTLSKVKSKKNKNGFTICKDVANGRIVDITSKGKYQLIDFKGKVILKPIYDNIEYKNGYFYATKGNNIGVFDKNGKIVIKLGKYKDIIK